MVAGKPWSGVVQTAGVVCAVWNAVDRFAIWWVMVCKHYMTASSCCSCASNRAPCCPSLWVRWAASADSIWSERTVMHALRNQMQTWRLQNRSRLIQKCLKSQSQIYSTDTQTTNRSRKTSQESGTRNQKSRGIGRTRQNQKPENKGASYNIS